MSRGFPDDVATALAQQNVAIVTFAKLEFPSGTVYLHNSLGSYTWGGHDWLGVGDLGSISQVEEGLDVSPYAITLTLSGLDATISGAALTEDYYLHGVTVYLGVLDTDDVLIDTPTQIWGGFSLAELILKWSFCASHKSKICRRLGYVAECNS